MRAIQLDEQGITRTLQAAIDHYPRLLAVRATLRLPDAGAQPMDALIIRFQTVLRKHINVFIDSRQSAGKPAPPTQISLFWGVERDGSIPILLLLNQDTFYSVRHEPSLQPQIDAVNALIGKAGSSVIEPSNELVRGLVSEILGYIQITRGDVDTYPAQYAVLSNNAMSLSSVTSTIR